MPSLAELNDRAARLSHDAHEAHVAGEHAKTNALLDQLDAVKVEITGAQQAEQRMRGIGDWDTPQNAVPMTSVEVRDLARNDEERGARTNANYKPRGWAQDLETRTDLGPAVQTPWVQRYMGDNLKAEARMYVDVFEKWLRARTETKGVDSFFGNASADEQRMMRSYLDKSEGSYYVPEILRARMSGRNTRLAEIRALGETVDTAGGIFVPEDARMVVLHDPGVPGGVIRPRCQVITTSLRDGFLPALGSVQWQSMQEAAPYPDNTPATGQVSFTTRKSGGQVVVSFELLEDTAVALPPLLTRIFTEAKGRWEDQQVIQGDGTTTFEGLRTSLGAGQTFILAGPTAITAVDVIGAYWSLPSQFRPGASWYTTSSLMQQIEAINATSAGIHFGGGDYGAGMNLANSPEIMLRGKSIDLFDGTGWDDATAIAANEVLGCIGNFDNYLMVDRIGMTLKRDDSINVKTDQVWFGARMREDGRVGIQNSFRLIQAHS